MEQNMDNRQTSVMQGICGAMEEMKHFVKRNAVNYKCHVISPEKLQELYLVSQKIKGVLDILNIPDSTFGVIHAKIEELTLDYDLYRVSVLFDEELLPLLDSCIQEISERYLPQDENKKPDIRVKYVDFYSRFNPKEHWTYKILERKYNVVFSESPDYLFFSCFGNTYLQYNCIRIFISNEAVYPNLNLYDYAVTYADFKITDRLLPNRDAFEELKYRRLAEDWQTAEEILGSKEEFCNFVYSNGFGDPYREQLFRSVSQYKKVLSGGKFQNNIGHVVEDLHSFQSRFKFSIACENSWYRGYTTEKIINAFNAGTIPIYWGNPDISSVINPKAIINCHDYPDLESVVEEIKRLDEDDEAYKKKLMEPILVQENMVEEYLRERENFIYHIIDQPYMNAYRRNLCLRGQYYNDWFCHMLGYDNEWFSPEKGYFVKKSMQGE